MKTTAKLYLPTQSNGWFTLRFKWPDGEREHRFTTEAEARQYAATVPEITAIEVQA